VAMTNCKECNAQISTTAASCPQCGALPRKTSGCAVIIAVFLGLAFFSAIMRGCAENSTVTPPSTSTSEAPAQTSPEAAAASAPAEPDPKVVLEEAKNTISDIESRLKGNAEKLKKYYGTTNQVQEATGDLVKLAAIKGLYGDSKAKDEMIIAKRADDLFNKVYQQRRVIYASVAEEIFVKNGMDAKVTANGSKNEQLKIKYILMSKPLVYKFQNEMEISTQARNFGFRKIIYTDGYDETWTVDL